VNKSVEVPKPTCSVMICLGYNLVHGRVILSVVILLHCSYFQNKTIQRKHGSLSMYYMVQHGLIDLRLKGQRINKVRGLNSFP